MLWFTLGFNPPSKSFCLVTIWQPTLWFRETFLQVKSPVPKVQVPWWPKWKQLGGLGLHFAYFAYLSTYRWYCTGFLERLSQGLVGSRSTKQARRVRAGDKQKVQEVDDGNKPRAWAKISPQKMIVSGWKC